MASPLGASGQAVSESIRDHGDVPVASSSQSSSSIHTDDNQDEYNQNDQHTDNEQQPICPWRTSRFHNQECLRYFDCPSHSIERSLSENGSADQESIHGSYFHERPHLDNEQNQPSEQTARFSNQELAQVGISRENTQTTTTDESDDDRYGASAASDPVTSAEGVSISPAAQQQPEQPSSNTPQFTNSSDTESSSHNRRSKQPESPSSAPDRPEHRDRSGRGTSGTNTTPSQQSQRTYATPSRERMDAPLPSLRPLEEALPPLPRSARPSISLDPQRPRWQPDNEVTYCPICHTQFSFFVRKHHCRIIIPHQYIVRPPGAEMIWNQTLLVDALGAGYFDVNDMSGGERGSTSSGSSPGISYRRRTSTHQTPIERLLSSAQSASSSSYPERYSSLGESSRQRALPPTPQIAEEDECPICHRELPSQSLPNAEELREAHITTCIQTHSRYGTPRGGEGGAPVAPRRTGMYTYVATEKDCIDDAECTICLEEFTVGVAMARLECLCRFHRACISSWFVKHPGRCPVHQHDGFGY
ncbi:hypothetical protein FGRMN_9085 [Fusarium graminum]|nr:hypothetical protein FGRMN_9085 [Fusarium graminum]